MGIFDLKVDNFGQPNFLECNQQGQFLFLQEVTGFDLLSEFSTFFVNA